MPLAPGARLGPYEVLGALGAGGMGEVYRARDARLDREVALKVLPASFATDPERLGRFELEARTTGQLNHPNVVAVYDLGTGDGAPYLVTELLEGQTLRERLVDGPVPPRKALDFAIQITRGLAAAHAKDIVHRDLKPENLFLTKDGHVKILDFGLARVAAPAGKASSAATILQPTNPGTVLGTVGYMSPEQVRGRPADARSDLFAVGVVLYEMLSGGQPFARPSAADTMAAILKEDAPDLSASGASIAPAVERVIRRCLEKDPDERFQSARDLGFALDAVGASTSTSGTTAAIEAAGPASPRSSNGRARIFVAAGLLTALAGGALVGRFILAPTPEAAPTDVTLRQLTFGGAVPAGDPALSPDGASFVFVSAAAGNRDIWLQRVGGDNPVNLTRDSPADDYAPAFSPDGHSIAFRSERDGGGIFVMGATGESVRRLTTSGFDPAWSPDGRTLVVASEHISDPASRQGVSTLSRVDVATGAMAKIYDGDAVQPNWSPNGKFLAFWGLPPGMGRRTLYTMPAGGGPALQMLSDGATNWSPVWSSDGRFIYYASDIAQPMSLWRMPMDPATGRPRGRPERVTVATEEQDGVSPEVGGAFLFPAVSDSWTLERRSFDPATDRLGPPVDVLSHSTRGVGQIAPSPDGQWLVAVISDATEDLEVMRADGTQVTRLTNDAFHDRGVAWAPDSDRIFFYSDRGGQYDVWSIRKDGSGLRRETGGTTYASGRCIQPVPSPDGRTLAVLTLPDLRTGLIDLSAAPDQRRVQLLPTPGAGLSFQASAWSPDGRTIVGGLSGNGGSELAVYSVADRTYRKVPGATVAVGLLPGNRLVASNAGNQVLTIDLANGAVRTGDAFPADAAAAVVTSDGRTAYVVRRQIVSNIWMLTPPRH